MMQYGFQRLVMLGSAGYQRAELPLDAAVSLIAPNNTGKTSLINALQFLLIVNRGRMDFGAHDVEKSRKFYFPNNSAYILLEVVLPGSGTVVLGCVGKGVSYEYEYFAYKGQLDIDDFKLPNGAVVTQLQLKAHLATRAKLVFSYSASEFGDAIYGNRSKRQDHEPDITLFKLEHRSLAGDFQQVLTKTLQLDRLKSKDVKKYLLSIFRRDLPDASINFKAEWDKAFADVNAERAQYDAAFRHQKEIASLAANHDERLNARGKVISARPRVDAALASWASHYCEHREKFEKAIAGAANEQEQLRLRGVQLAEDRFAAKQGLETYAALERRQAELRQQFALIDNRTILEARLAESREALNVQIALVQQAGATTADAIMRTLARSETELKDVERQQATLEDNLYLRLQSGMAPEQLEALNRVLSKSVMTLGASHFAVSTSALSELGLTWAPAADGTCTALPGIVLDLDALSPQHTQKKPEELAIRAAELNEEVARLKIQVEVARAMQEARELERRLDKDVRSLEAEVILFDEMTALLVASPQRAIESTALKAKYESIEEELAASTEATNKLREDDRKTQSSLARLETTNKEIGRLRDNRGDTAPVFAYLADLPHYVWVDNSEFILDRLSTHLDEYRNDCRRLQLLDDILPRQVAELHSYGLTKFLYMGGDETEIDRIVAFAAHLPQEAEALERKARSAIVNVTACLRELRDGLGAFKGRMRDFNRLISRRQLSDLDTFKIEPADNATIVEAIELLISTAEKVDNGETFSLFNHACVLDDETLNRAKQTLISEGEARTCLSVEHLFEIEFVVGKAGRKAESFSDIDSAASNGTVLMAKLITGLALLHLMQDKRYPIQAVCYLDEASALDQKNQRSLIETASDFGFALIFASPAPLITARYCVPITNSGGVNTISRRNWQVIEPLEAVAP